jgi:hypothetical protein
MLYLSEERTGWPKKCYSKERRVRQQALDRVRKDILDHLFPEEKNNNNTTNSNIIDDTSSITTGIELQTTLAQPSNDEGDNNIDGEDETNIAPSSNLGKRLQNEIESDVDDDIIELDNKNDHQDIFCINILKSFGKQSKLNCIILF